MKRPDIFYRFGHEADFEFHEAAPEKVHDGSDDEQPGESLVKKLTLNV